MGVCHFCGASGPFGYQQPGLRRDRTDDRRIWACPAHRAEAERRWASHFSPGIAGGGGAPRPEKPPASQGNLFGGP